MTTAELKDLMNSFKNIAIRMMQTNDSVFPVACIPDINKVIGIPFKDDDEKEQVMFVLGSVVAKTNSSGVLVVIDAWVSMGVEKETLLPPRKKPVDDRGQALMISYYDLKGAWSGNRTIMVSYTSAKKVVDEEELTLGKHEDNIFKLVLSGYLKCKP